MPSLDKTDVAAALAGVSLIGLLLVIAALLFVEIPQGNRDLFNIGIMALISAVSSGTGYFLGSSASSAKKDEIIAQKMKPDG